ncbi:MAG: DNA-binding protein [Clostridia bacterium]|nr:DNA-binding protein [Clostridia bacterium]
MIEGYVTINEMAEKWHISSRRIRTMCSQGKIDGAAKFGTTWAIPIGAERPSDGRRTSGAYINWRKQKKAHE